MRTALKGQYHAALEMLRKTVEQFPDVAWTGAEHRNAPWQIAYHVLYCTHAYLLPDWESFRPWQGHQGDPKGDLPEVVEPYTRAQVLDYLAFVDAMTDPAVDALDLASPDSGFRWYAVPKLEHQLINLRHVQHHTGQLQDRLRAAADVGIGWVASGRGT